MGQVSTPPPPPPSPPTPGGIFGDNDFWIAQYVSFQYLLVCKMNYSAFRDYLRWYIAADSHVLKWACPLHISNNRQLYHSLDTQKYCTCWYQWVALLLQLLLSYPGMVAWITRVGLMKIKNYRISRCIILYNAPVKILNKSASFTTKCIMATKSKRVTENVWLAPALMDDVTE